MEKEKLNAFFVKLSMVLCGAICDCHITHSQQSVRPTDSPQTLESPLWPPRSRTRTRTRHTSRQNLQREGMASTVLPRCLGLVCTDSVKSMWSQCTRRKEVSCLVLNRVATNRYQAEETLQFFSALDDLVQQHILPLGFTFFSFGLVAKMVFSHFGGWPVFRWNSLVS